MALAVTEWIMFPCDQGHSKGSALLFGSFSTPSKSAIRKFQITEEEVKPSLFADKKKKKSLEDQQSSLADLQIQANVQKQKSIVFYYYY